jgi:ribonuclease P protein component
MVLFLRRAPDASARLGVVASKKVGNAVERARAKRRLRELFRRHRPLLPPGFAPDIVLVARRAILSAPWPRLVAEYAALVRTLPAS